MSAEMSPFLEEQLQLNNRREKLHPALKVLVNFFAQLEVRGLENLPLTGNTMLMGNHVSTVDPILITAAINSRYVISMAKAETLDTLITRFGLQTWGNFIVNRGEVDRVALKNAIDLIKAEQLLWIAPEGTRNPKGLDEARGGVSYIAHKAQATIVPTAMCGPQTWWQRLSHFRQAEALIVFGKPFRFRIPEGERLSRDVREQMIQEAMYQLAITMPEEYAYQRGVYSDIENATTKYLDFL